MAVDVAPIKNNGYSSELKKAVDRIICLISPLFKRIDGEVNHHDRYARYPDLLGVGVLPAPHAAQEQIFHTLFFFQAEDGIRDTSVTGVQTCALPICRF